MDQLARALLLLEEAPEAGAVAPTWRPGTRRVLLRRSRLWVYYGYDRRHEVVSVLAVSSPSATFPSPLPPSMTRPDLARSQNPAGFDRAAYGLNDQILSFLRRALDATR